MKALHTLVLRQLRRSGVALDAIGSGPWNAFVQAVSEAYEDADSDRLLLERSIELSSQELVQANSEMRAIIQAFPDLFMWIDTQGLIVGCKSRSSDDLTYSPRGLRGRKIQSLPGREAGLRFEEAIRSIVAGAEIAQVEYALQTDGVDREYEARLLPLGSERIIVVIRNVTDTVVAKRRLQETVSVLGATLEATADGILVVGRDGRVVNYNHQFVEQWGIPEELIERQDHLGVLEYALDQLANPEDSLTTVRALSKEQQAETLDELKLKDGRVFERLSKPHRVGEEVVGRVWSFRDVTRQRTAAAELSKAHQAALVAARSQAEFLANMSHEIRTPMNGIIGVVDLLMATRLDSEQQGLAETVRSSGQSLMTILNDILDLSKIEEGRLAIDLAPMSVVEAVRSVTRLFAQTAAVKGIALHCEIDLLVPPYVLGDGARIRQIVTNLVGNAVKFTEVGRVVVSVHTLGPTQQDVGIRIAVKDTGIGIPQSDCERIFERFTQADASTTRRFGGTGLGLAISKRLTDLMGGEIEVRSEPGVGSEFAVTLRLPVCANVLAMAEEPRSSGSAPACVLLVEDNPVNQRVASLMLKRLGHAVHLAQNGLEAFQMASTRRFDVILMDCQMPVMDGYEATLRIRQSGSSSSTPIIALTAKAMADDREHCMENGMNDFLAKPIRLRDLETTLERWLPLRRSEAA